jgi:hypothetical protein
MKHNYKAIAFLALLCSSSVFAQSPWLLTGNSGTSPGTNFLGTTDAQRLVFKTNATERMTILTTGYTGINTSTPGKLLTLQGSNTSDNAELLVKQLSGSTLGSYLTLDNIVNGGKAWSIGSTGTLNSPTVKGALEFYELGFGTRMILDSSGNFGVAIGNGVLPTAVFHTKGTVRHQNLPAGTGTALVIDANGYVYRDSVGSFAKAAAGSQEVSQSVGDLQNEVNDLKQQILELKSLVRTCNPGVLISDNPSLFQNIPNPSPAALTTIRFYIPSSKEGELVITDMAGNVRKKFSSLASGSQRVSVSSSDLGNGTYIYSLYVNGTLFQSKKMIIAQ